MGQTNDDTLFVVGIGASAGGLPALTEMLERASCHKSMCFVIVSHIPRDQTSRLAEILGRVSSLKSHVITDGLRVEHCHLYTLPPNFYVEIEGGVLRLVPRPDERTNRSVNHFFKSLARNYGPNAIGVVLSGALAGSDGANGVAVIKAAGGHTYAQDPTTAEFPHMPREAIATGSVDSILSPERIGFELSLISWAL